MAEKFNMTRFPFLKYLGGEFNSKVFYKNIFLLRAWDNDEANKAQSRLHRQWYSTHRNEFMKHICIWNHEAEIHDCYDELTEAAHGIPDGYEESGVFISSADSGFAYLYTVMFHGSDYIKRMADEGIETDDIEVRVMCAFTKALSRCVQHFSISALSLINTHGEKNNFQLAVSDLSYSNASGEQMRGLDKEIRTHITKIVMSVVFRYAGKLEEYSMEHGLCRLDDVVFPMVNYTSLNMTYINNLKLDSNKEERTMESEVLKRSDGYTLQTGGVLAYEVTHNPIDYVLVGEDKHSPMWGWKTVFNPLAKDSEMYRRLYKAYDVEEPIFIGRMRMPVASETGCRIDLFKVYMVRCSNNGTTYFLSDSMEALEPFCH